MGKLAATGFDPSFWSGVDDPLIQHLQNANRAALAAYEAHPPLVYEHANIERSTSQGGYGRRQLYELVQNGADALVGTRGGRIHVVLTDDAVYCANEGEPIDAEGVTAILRSHVSLKRGTEIGRFGLGFKSVLSVTDRPEFYSWSGSFGFSADWCREQILDRVPDLASRNSDDRTPTLRLAAPLDAAVHATDDPVLAELMAWATTVVKLPRKDSLVSQAWLTEDIETFPAQFMLFSPHVKHLRLENRSTLIDRKIEVVVIDQVHHLREGDIDSQWRVFSRPDYRPSPEALEDAGELAHRETVPLIWAVPTQGRERLRRGRFWAFFPTEYETTLAGIVNAPWKTNEDRQNLLPGVFNDELVEEFADLIVESLPQLVDPEDPGSFLELLPARGQEAPSPTDRLLTDRFIERASAARSLPDQNGDLQRPADLRIHPVEATLLSLEHWSGYPGRPDAWCHPTIFQRDRRASAERLLPDPAASIAEWLEALVGDRSRAASMSAIKAASALSDESGSLPVEIRGAKFVLSATGDFVAPDPNTVFLPVEATEQVEGIETVDRLLAEDETTLTALTHLGLHPADTVAVLRGILAAGIPSSMDWEHFWRLTRLVSPNDVIPLILAASNRTARFRDLPRTVKVKARSGKWLSLDSLLLPGIVVSLVDETNAGVTVDTDFHADDIETLAGIGAREVPENGAGDTREPWFRQFREQALEEYYEMLESSAQPRADYLDFDRKTFVGPLIPLGRLDDDARARFTRAVLEASDDLDSTWTLSHRTSAVYPRREYMSPALWLLRNDGAISTSLGPVRTQDAVGPKMKNLGSVLPVARLSDEWAELLDLPEDAADIGESVWQSGFLRLDEVTFEPIVLGDFYAEASYWCDPPAELRATSGDRIVSADPAAVTVVVAQGHFESLARDHKPVVLVRTEVEAVRLVDDWGLRPASDVVQTSISAMPSAPGTPISDRFPDLVLIDADLGQMFIRPCESIVAVTITDLGRHTEERNFAVDEGVILYRDDLSDSDVLSLISDKFELEFSTHEIDAIVEGVEDAHLRTRMAEVALASTDAERLSLLLDRTVIARRLPEGLVSALTTANRDDAVSLSQAALAVYGVGVLRAYSEDLADAGWAPPARLVGSREARTFARHLGFSAMYAGRERPSRFPSESVAGPAFLPTMHDFQRSIAETTTRLIESGSGRGLLSLPTGAGKTRVAVESAITAIKTGSLDGPILWIAQTDELCEQAVDTWSFVWRAIGPQRTLNINRLWGSFEAQQSRTDMQVVITTIAKIVKRVGDASYDWLSKASCVFIDEAHGSTTPSYTKVLTWLGMGRRKERVPLIGLTATPFRGTSEEQTKRLVNRYSGNRLDRGVFGQEDPYVRLQKMSVLAEVDHQLLDGIDIELSEAELVELEQRHRLPSNVGERIGADAERNRTIIRAVTDLDDSWPVLLFAASVDHAQTLAALLTLDGIPSAAISGQTDRYARRHYIEQFRSGDLRVLTNYNVLTQGFDAPATRVVFVARPTFSANLYQQMIGRGLRGPLNGGKERCLIINVADNVRAYGEELAFYDFEHLWTSKTDV